MNTMTTKKLAKSLNRQFNVPSSVYKKSRYNKQGSHVGKAQAARYAARKESDTKGVKL